jgi:phosphate transport system protein
MTQYQLGLDQLKERLLLMASLSTLAVSNAVQAYIQRDPERACQVTLEDGTIDELEAAIDALAIDLLARGPLALNLRFITVAMRFSRHLERVGDEASGIASRVIELSKGPPLAAARDIPQMATLGISMLNEALDAFVNRDVDRARQIIRRDAYVDELNKQLHREMKALIIQMPAFAERCLDLMAIAKRLERIADHAKALSELVVYLWEGCDIRHSRNRFAEAV